MPRRIYIPEEQVRQAVEESRSFTAAARLLGYPSRSAGMMVKRWAEEFGIPTDHFGGPGSHTGRSSNVINTREEIEEAVRMSQTFSDVCRQLGRTTSGGTHTHVRRMIERLGIDTSHFLSRSEATRKTRKAGSSARTAENTLVLYPSGSNRAKASLLRRLMTSSGVIEECAVCGLGPEWNGQYLLLDVDHINGNFLDSRLENLRFLCPNCHRQQPTSRARAKRY